MKKIFPALLLFVLLTFACTPQQDDTLYRIQTHLDELENRIARIEESLSSSNRDLSNLKSEVDAINLELSRTSKFIAEFKDMDFISTEDVEKMSRRITDLELKYAQVSAVMNVSDIRELIYKLSDVESAQKMQEEKYQRFVETTERLLKEANIEEFASKFKELENAVISMENQIDEASEMAVRVEALERSVENLSLQAPNSGNNSSSSKVIFELTRDVSELKNSLSDIKNVIREEIDRKIAALPTDSPEALQQYVVNTTSLVKQLTVELETLRSVVREYDRNRFLRLDEGYVSYIVKSGDNLSTIARTYNLGLDGVRRIVELNNISDPNKLLVGQMLKIPVDDPSELFCYPLGKPFSPEQIAGVFGEITKGGTKPGIDVNVESSLPVHATLPGRVVSVFSDSQGTHVRIDHGNGILAVYGNLVKVNVHEGQWVSSGEIIGTSGNTFHFEMWIDGEPRDPLRILLKYAGKFEATFYTEWEDGKLPAHPAFRVTSSGTVPREWWTLAADTHFLPMGSLVYIPAFVHKPNRGFFKVEDTGAAIKGNKIDIYTTHIQDALKGMRAYVDVYLVPPTGSY